MKTRSRRPVILVSADTEPKGPDSATTLPEAYQQALLMAGAIPLTMPATTDPAVITTCVERADGILLTGGDDVNPELYGAPLPAELRAKVNITPDHGRRDFREVQLVAEAFRQSKPLLAICRGQQILNVALGGTLIADLATQHPEALPHRRMDKKREIVHQVRLTAGSLLARIVGVRSLGVNSTHHQAVARVAPMLKPVAVSPDGIVEGLELKPEAVRRLPFLLAVQFHPERLADRYAQHRAIFEAFTAAC